MNKRKRYLIEWRYYRVGSGWGEWHFTYDRADVFWDKRAAIMKLQEYKRDETDCSEYRLSEEWVDLDMFKKYGIKP